MPSVEVSSGVHIAYQIVGEGEPLLLIPGTGQGGKLWSLQVPCVQRSAIRLILLDNRGVGASDVPEDGYTIRQMAEDAADVLRALGSPGRTSQGSPWARRSPRSWRSTSPAVVATLQLHSTWDQPYPHLVRQLRLRQELARRELWDLFAMNSVLSLFTPGICQRASGRPG